MPNLEYEQKTPEDLSSTKKRGAALISLVINVPAVALSVMPLSLGFHLAGCHVTAEKWCVLGAIIELLISLPIGILVLSFSLQAIFETTSTTLRVIVGTTALVAIGNCVFLALALTSGPWW